MAKIANSVPLGGFIAPNDSADTYATHDEQYGRGGFRSVADITARNAIPADRRKEGMEVKVLADGKRYELVGGTANANWQEVFTGGSVDETAISAAVDTYMQNSNITSRLDIIEGGITLGVEDITGLSTVKKMYFSRGNREWLLNQKPVGDNIKSLLIPIKKDKAYNIRVSNNDRFGLLFLTFTFEHYEPIYGIDLHRGFVSHDTKEYTFYNDTDYNFVLCYYNQDLTTPGIQVFEISGGNEVNDKYRIRRDIAFSDIDVMLENRVDDYIAENGLFINAVAKTRVEIKEWLLNRNTCIYRGKLRKSGKYIVDQNNDPISLQGVALFHIPDLAPSLHTYESLRCLKYYGVNLIRLPAYMKYRPYVDEAKANKYCRGYIEDPDLIESTMDQIIDWCIDLGLYVMVDFHVLSEDDDVNQYTDQAVRFFTHFTTKYSASPNIIYEILNEPLRNSIASLQPYLSTVVPIIRTNVVEPVMIMGRPIYDEDVPTVHAWLTTNGFTDLFVSFHVYWGTQDILSQYQTLWAADIPLVVSEWGNCETTGYGVTNDVRTIAFLEWAYQNNVMTSNWKQAYRDTTSSLLREKPGAADGYYKYGFVNNDLRYNGVLLLKKFFNLNQGIDTALVTPTNELAYDFVTWSEWTKDINVITNKNGITFTGISGTATFASIPTNLVPNTKYGLLYEIGENGIDNDFGLSATSAFDLKVLEGKYTSGYKGLRKHILTTKATITSNQLRFYCSSQMGTGKSITLRNIRLYELPDGSDILDKFETLSAEALNAYYLPDVVISDTESAIIDLDARVDSLEDMTEDLVSVTNGHTLSISGLNGRVTILENEGGTGTTTEVDLKTTYTWYEGSRTSGVQQFTASNNRLTTSEILRADTDIKVSMSDYTTYLFAVYPLDETGTYVSGTITPYLTEDYIIPKGMYFGIIIRKLDDSIINGTTGGAYNSLFIKSVPYIDLINNNIKALNIDKDSIVNIPDIEIGAIDFTTTGGNTDNAKRARAIKLIEVKQGTRIQCFGDYSFLIAFYDNTMKFIGGMSGINYNWRNDFIIQETYNSTKIRYIRFVIRKGDGSADIADIADVARNIKITAPVITETYRRNTKGKILSILGDSFATFTGYNPTGYRSSYPSSITTDVTRVTEMWWHIVIEALGFQTGIIGGWGGSRVSWDEITEDDFQGANIYMASDARINALDDNGVPDVILFEGGTNDITNAVTIGTFDKTDLSTTTVDTFANAYKTALIKLQTTYPNSTVVAMIPCYADTAKYIPSTLDAYASVMIDICNFFGVPYIDLRKFVNNYNKATYQSDGIHPNVRGNLLLSRLVSNELQKIIS